MFGSLFHDVTPKRQVFASNLSTLEALEGTLKPIRSPSPSGPRLRMKSLLSKLANDPILRTLHAAPPRPSELAEFYRIVLDQVGRAVASYDVVRSVYEHNRASILVLYGDDAATSTQPEIIGILTVLYLSPRGEQALIDGTFNAREVKREWLSAADEEPAALYAWAIAGGSRLGRIRLARVAQYLSFRLFGEYTQYGYAATSAGRALMEKLEFVDALPLLPTIRPGTYVRWGKTGLRRFANPSEAVPSTTITRQ